MANVGQRAALGNCGNGDAHAANPADEANDGHDEDAELWDTISELTEGRRCTDSERVGIIAGLVGAAQLARMPARERSARPPSPAVVVRVGCVCTMAWLLYKLQTRPPASVFTSNTQATNFFSARVSCTAHVNL